VLDLMAQLDREFSERGKFEALLRGATEWFTGTARIDPLFQAPDPALVQGASVTFEPGARTEWHRHFSARPLSSRLDAAGCSAREGRSKKFAPATSCGSRLAKSTGMAPRRLRQ